MPTKYDVTIALGEEPEELPEIDEDLLVDVGISSKTFKTVRVIFTNLY